MRGGPKGSPRFLCGRFSFRAEATPAHTYQPYQGEQCTKRTASKNQNEQRQADTVRTAGTKSPDTQAKSGKAECRDSKHRESGFKCGGQSSAILRLSAPGDEHFGGGDELTDVALGVVGDVDERAAEGNGQLLAADVAGRVEVGGGEGGDARGGV